VFISSALYDFKPLGSGNAPKHIRGEQERPELDLACVYVTGKNAKVWTMKIVAKSTAFMRFCTRPILVYSMSLGITDCYFCSNLMPS
jgi:hypothetical protein